LAITYNEIKTLSRYAARQFLQPLMKLQTSV